MNINNKLSILFLFSISSLLVSHVANAKCNHDKCQTELSSGVSIDGDYKGNVRYTKNKIILDNIKIYQKNSGNPALQVVTKSSDRANRRVYADNIIVTVKNADVSTSNGMAASVGFHLENAGNKIKGVQINSSGTNRYSSISGKNQNAAGVNVMQLSKQAAQEVDVSAIEINNSGSTILNAIQEMP